MSRLITRSTSPADLRGLVAVALVGLALACGVTPSAPTATTTAEPTTGVPPTTPVPVASREWDLSTRGLPRFVTRSYLDPNSIARISRFRSGVGHSYTDSVETCRSMKHYFQPRQDIAWGSIPIVSPVGGDVVGVVEEWAGVQIHIAPRDYPAFRVILFHVKPSMTIALGDHFAAGQPIGAHVSGDTMSDVAVGVDTPQGYVLVSWLDVLTDAAFNEYASRGVPDRATAIISRAERDAHPLTCSGEQFASPGDRENWVELR